MGKIIINTTHYEAGNSVSGQGVEAHNYNASYDYGQPDILGNDIGYQQGNRFHDMVTDAFHETTPVLADNPAEAILEEPNIEAQKFYDMLDAANQPLYDGCREGIYRLSLAARMMTIKSEDNSSESKMDKSLQENRLIAKEICDGKYPSQICDGFATVLQRNKKPSQIRRKFAMEIFPSQICDGLAMALRWKLKSSQFHRKFATILRWKPKN